MTDWQDDVLENCLEALLDYRGKSPPKSSVGIPVLSAKVVKTSGLLHPIEQKIASDYYSKWMVRGLPHVGDVVMTTEGPMGEVIQLTEETVQYALGQRIVCLRGKSGVLDNTFLRYLLSSPSQQNILESYSTGTTVPGISQKALRSVPISYPSFDTQKRIGILLSSIDDKIDLNRRTNETLEAMARALFRDWFVDFGPTRAKMAGEAPYLAPELWELFPDRLDDEEKPKGWKISRIGDCVERLKVGKLYSQKDLALSGKVPVLDQGKNGIIGYHNNAPNIAASPTERVCTFANHTCTQKLIDFPFSTIQNVIPFKGKNFPSEWIFFATLGKQKFQEYKGHWPDFIEQTICTPNKNDVVNLYLKMIDPMLRKQSENIREIDTLAQLRDLLLPKLMSGEISIRDAKKMVEDAA